MFIPFARSAFFQGMSVGKLGGRRGRNQRSSSYGFAADMGLQISVRNPNSILSHFSKLPPLLRFHIRSAPCSETPRIYLAELGDCPCCSSRLGGYEGAHTDPDPSAEYEEHRNYFAEQILLSAALHTRRARTTKAHANSHSSDDASSTEAGVV